MFTIDNMSYKVDKNQTVVKEGVLSPRTAIQKISLCHFLAA
jgi:hypothetical protein